MAASKYRLSKSKKNGYAQYPKTIVEAVTWDEKKKPLAEVLEGKIDQPLDPAEVGKVPQVAQDGTVDWVVPLAGSTADSAMSGSSTNAPQNKVVKAYVDAVDGKVSELGHKIDDLALGKFYGFFPADTDLPAGDDPGYAYVGASAPFAIYVFNEGEWSDSGSVYGPAEGNGEDIDTNAQGKLQFANRPTTYGMGYKILRRDATFASQVGDSDTIYEIRYDFDLGGASVTIPAGCVLKFVGGKLSNGTITGNNTSIIATETRIFDGVSLAGKWYGESNPIWFGAISDLSTDATSAIQSCVDYFDIINIDGQYATHQINLKSNKVLNFSPTSILKAVAGYSVYECVLSCDSISNVIINGNGATLQGRKDEYTEIQGQDPAEYRHGLRLYGSSNIHIYNLNSIDMGGDGFVVGGGYPCHHISLSGCRADNNSRQGLSITNVEDLLVENCVFSNTYSARLPWGPWAGIDIESNQEGVPDVDSYYYIKDVNIIGCRAFGNKGPGLLITPQHYLTPVSIVVNGYVSEGDAVGLKFNNPNNDGDNTHKQQGVVSVRDYLIINPNNSGLVVNAYTDKAPLTKVENILIKNVGYDGNTNNRTRSAIFLRTENGLVNGTSDGNITIANVKIVDDRTTPNTFAAIYAEENGSANNPLKNFKVENLDYSEAQISGEKVVLLLYNNDVTENVNIMPTTPYILGSTTTLARQVYSGSIGIVRGGNITLPAATKCVGTILKVNNVNGLFQLFAPSGDSIKWNGAEYGSFRGDDSGIGNYIILKSTSTGWNIVSIAGEWLASASAKYGATIVRGTYFSNESSMPNPGDVFVSTKAHNWRENYYGLINMGTAGTPKIKYMGPAFSAPFLAYSSLQTLTSDDIGYSQFYTTYNMPLWYDGSKFVDALGYKALLKRGTTANRPSLSSTDYGYQYYDSDLKKYIVWDGTAWVNIDGTAL